VKRSELKRTGGPKRRGTVKVCEVCCAEFYRPPALAPRARFCSRECMGKAARKPLICAVCGAEYAHRNRTRKTCSPKCEATLRTRVKTGRLNPQYSTGLGEDRRRWRSGLEERCRLCGGSTRLTSHHVVYEQHVRRMRGDTFDPANSLTVCFGCHMGHHHGADRRIRIDQLRPENLEFAQTLLGAWATDYLARYYAPAGNVPWLGPDDLAELERAA